MSYHEATLEQGGPQTVTDTLIKETWRLICAQGEGPVKAEAEIGVRLLPAQEPQRWPANCQLVGRGMEQTLTMLRVNPADTLILDFLPPGL